MLKHILFTVAIFILNMATSLKAQSNIEITIDHYAINVSDLNGSVDFYQDVFDLKEIQNGTGLPYIRWFRLGKSAELHIIEVDSLDMKLPKGVHLALAASHFESFRKRLEAKKISYSDWPGKLQTVSLRPDGIQQIYFQDPDGYWIEVNDASSK